MDIWSQRLIGLGSLWAVVFSRWMSNIKSGLVSWVVITRLWLTYSYPRAGVLVSTAQNATSFANFSQLNLTVFHSGQGAATFCIPLDFSKSNVTGLQAGQNVTIQVSHTHILSRWSRVHSNFIRLYSTEVMGHCTRWVLSILRPLLQFELISNSAPILHSWTTSTYLRLSHAQTLPVRASHLRVLFLLWWC